MANVTFVGAGSAAQGHTETGANSATYLSIGTNFCTFDPFAGESFRQANWKDAGTFSRLSVNVRTNTFSNATHHVYDFRIATVSGNESISVTGGSTGTFIDTVDTDTVSAAALVNYRQLSGTGAGNLRCTNICCAFSSSSFGAMMNISDWSAGQPLGSGLTLYSHPGGSLLQLNATENTGMASRMKACTVTGFYFFCDTNTLNQAATLKVRVALANGNGSISVPANTSGSFRDGADSDTVANNALLDYQCDSTAAASGICDTVLFGGWQEYAAGGAQNLSSGQATAINSLTGTGYIPFVGNTGESATEADSQVPSPGVFSWINLRIITLTGPTTTITYNSRKNGGNGNQSVSIGNGVFGTFEDTVDSDLLAPGDLICSALELGASNAIQYNVITSQLGPLPQALPKPKPRPKKRVFTAGGGLLPPGYNQLKFRYRRPIAPFIPPGPSGGVHQEIVWFGVRAIVVENTNQAGRMLGFTLNSTSADFSLIMAELASKEDAYVANNP